MVSVTPELSSSAVLMVGSQNGADGLEGLDDAGRRSRWRRPRRVGHTALKSGHSRALSRLPSAGSEWVRAHHSAVKKAPKNITSEKMNQLMLQRNERSTLWPYWPPSLSPMASRNQTNSVPNSHISMPTSSDHAPQPWPLIHWRGAEDDEEQADRRHDRIGAMAPGTK